MERKIATMNLYIYVPGNNIEYDFLWTPSVNLTVWVINNFENKFKDRTYREKITIFYAAVIKDFFEKKKRILYRTKKTTRAIWFRRYYLQLP